MRIPVHRKPLEDQPDPFGSTWELRCGAGNQLRVFYEFSLDRQEFWVLAIGVKERDRLVQGSPEHPIGQGRSAR